MELSSSSCAEIGVPIFLRRVSQGISVVAHRKASHLSCMMVNGGFLWGQSRGIVHHFALIWATPSYFTFLRGYQCHSRLVRDFWGTLCSSVKQIKDPYLFDWEQAVALQAEQGNRATSLSEGEISWFFSSCGGNLGYILELRRWYPLKTYVCSAASGHLSSYDGHLRNLN